MSTRAEKVAVFARIDDVLAKLLRSLGLTAACGALNDEQLGYLTHACDLADALRILFRNESMRQGCAIPADVTMDEAS